MTLIIFAALVYKKKWRLQRAVLQSVLLYAILFTAYMYPFIIGLAFFVVLHSFHALGYLQILK